MPQFATEMKQTADAQASRGARVTGGPLGGVRMLGSVAIPLFTGVFRHAETLSAAMDARCYHGEQGRTRLHALAFGRGDALAAVVTALLLICVIVINLQLVYRSEWAHPVAARLSADKRGLTAFCRLYGVPPDVDDGRHERHYTHHADARPHRGL